LKYAYEDLSDRQFETLVVLVCQRLFGLATQPFAEGPDGGRDAKFVGTAERHPSTAAPWVGTTIIQAKHTNGYNRSFSESDFYNPKSQNTLIGKEIPRIKKLRASCELDHYILFANRRMTGKAQNDISHAIADPCGLPIGSIYLCGVEQLELLLVEFPDIPAKASLDMVDAPLVVNSFDIAEVVEAFAASKEAISAALESPPTPRVSYESKNALNGMTSAYAKTLRQRHLRDTSQIWAFLADPTNAEIVKAYQAATEEFQMKIMAKRKLHQSFDEIMEYLLALLFGRDPVLRKREHRRLTRALLFYMYWNCDIGET
jgi:hypothetical protein